MESGGFTNLHVSGLPADCGEDADVELALRRALTTHQAGRVVETEDSVTCEGANAADGGGVNDGKGILGSEIEQDGPTQCLAAEVVEPVNDDLSDVDVGALERPKQDVLAEEVLAEGSVRPECKCEPTATEEKPDLETADVIQPEVASTALQDKAEEGDHDADEVIPFVSCVVVRNKDTNACKGYCFLSFPSLGAAEKALHILNDGVLVSGARVQAQISQPKERHAKPKDPTEHVDDLRLRRQRYQDASKKKKNGHVSCSNKSATIATKTGRINAVAGTRGGKLQVFDDGKMSSRSGFACAK